MKRITGPLRRNFLAGLLVTIPFGLTIFILFKLDKWIIGLVSAAPAKFLIEPLSELPTAFNPTGGYYIMIPEDEVNELPISVEDAFRIIVSGGLASNQSESARLSEKDDKAV